jgi:hypothetical protein
MSSRAAIEPAIATLPVKNQLIANVSSVPKVRQLTALSTDLVCVSVPRNKTTRRVSLAGGDRIYHAGAFYLPAACLALEITNGHGARIRAFCAVKSGKLFDLTE